MFEPTSAIDRATFLRQASGLLAAAFLDRSGISWLAWDKEGLEHPEPREGITGEHVLTAEALGASVKPPVLEVYDAARTYPGIFDGIACGCSCGGKRGSHRSLLVCFETTQAMGCGACQEEGELVAKLAKEEKPLAEIRQAVDKKYG
jgi:hypothetical protein